jgi:hypothetical protein
MPATPILTVPRGADRSWTFELRDSADGSLIVDYGASDALDGAIWSGLDQSPLVTLAPAWIDPTLGQVGIALAAADLDTLAPGLYRIEAAVTHDGARLPFLDGALEITPAPGSAATLAVYGTLNDLLLYAPQIQKLQDPRAELAGFLGERARARTWINEACLDGYRPNYGRARRYVSADGTTAGPHLRWVAAGPNGATTPTIADLRAALALGGLRVTEKVREAAAHMAAAIVYLNQPGRDNPYHQLGAQHQARAVELLATAVIEIDLDDPLDGTYDVRVGQDVTWLT